MVNLTKLVKYGFMAIFLCGNAIAMIDNEDDDKLLVIGCRPWDNNMQGFSRLDTAHFVDFMGNGGPTPLPDKFHHLDLDDEGKSGGGKFSEFAAINPGAFKAIILDWATYQHIHRYSAWADFATLLGSGGKLIIPVTSQNLTTGASLSNEKAEKIKGDKLANLFGKVDIVSYDSMPQDRHFDLLRRPNLESGRLEYAILAMQPAIIIATRQIAAEKSTLETENRISNILTEEPIQASAPIMLEKKPILERSAENISVGKSGKEVKFPDLDEIKERLRLGCSTVVSKTGDVFNIQSILGTFIGFRTNQDFHLRMIEGSTSKDYNKPYELSGLLEVMFADNKKMHLFLKKYL